MVNLKQIWQQYPHQVSVSLILIIATVLRFYNLTGIPLTNDELSALYRLHAGSFSELIHQGVIPDGHPALVQVFLYYYTALFGTASWVIKLPFLICGIASVYWAYCFISQAINRKTGLVVAAFMATSQFFIMHSQCARPYAPGLLFTLLFTHAMFHAAWKKDNRYFYRAAFFLLLAASTHYIALLTCVVTAGFFLWYDAAQYKKQLLAYGAAALCYLPQLPVFIAQFKTGGVGTWLGKPTPGFIHYFAMYLGHYNTVMLVVMLLLFIGGLACMLVPGSYLTAARKEIVLFAGIFTVVFLVTYFYSVYRNPVLQFPVLIFSTPFLLAFLFCIAGNLKTGMFSGLIIGLMLLQGYSLIFTRKHFEVFYRQSYKAAVADIVQHTRPGTPLLLNGNQLFYFDYYFKQWGYTPNIINARIDSIAYGDFDSIIRNLQADTVVVAHGFYLHPMYAGIAGAYYQHDVHIAHEGLNDTWILGRGDMTRMQQPSKVKQNVVVSKLKDPGTVYVEAFVNADVSHRDCDPQLVISVKDLQGKEWAGTFIPFSTFKKNQGGPVKITNALQAELPLKGDFEVSAFVSHTCNARAATLPELRVKPGNGRLYGTVMPLNER